MIIDLPADIETMIINEAQAQGVSVAQLIIQKFEQSKTTDTKNPMIARALALPKTNCFEGVDAVELQREWRDEWEY